MIARPARSALLPALLLLGCSRSAGLPRVEPTFLQVNLAESSALGSPESPLPFSSEPLTYTVTVQAQDVDGAPYAFDGDLTLDVRPGSIEQAPTVAITGGTWTGTVNIKNSFGPARVWLLDEGDRDTSSGRAISHAVGVSEPIHFALPTLAEMQRTDDTESNNLYGEFAELRVADRRVAVVARDAAGFWCTDIDDPPGSYNSVYVYTFGRPEDEVIPGAQITLLTGNNQEYLATTQLSFPTLIVDDTANLPVPPPVDLSVTGCAPENLEALESARVVLPDATIPANFLDNADYADKFLNYDEWPAVIDGCTVYVVSKGTAPDFNPVDHAGAVLPTLTGMLKEIYGDPVLVITDVADIVLP